MATIDFNTLADLLEDRAAAAPDRTAFIRLAAAEGAEEAITYGELRTRACGIAAMVRATAHRGDRVALAFADALDFIPAFFGCLYAGVIAVPVELPRNTRNLPRFLAICDDALPAVLLTSRASLELSGRRLEETDIVRSARLLYTDDASSAETAPDPSDLAYLQYTSGSTSVPKGVRITHANVLANCRFIDDAFKHDRETIGLSWLPHFHDMGLVYGLLQPVFGDFPCYLMPPSAFVQRPARWLEAISRLGVTHTGGPNFAYDLCRRRTTEEQRSTYALGSWRVAFNGAEPVRKATIDDFIAAFAPSGFRAAAMCPSYGLAEATLKVTARRPGEAMQVAWREGRELIGCGRVEASFADIAIVDPESGDIAAAGSAGEIYVSGPGVADGYWERSSESAAVFHARIPDDSRRWLRTGDLGFIEDNELYIQGRIKDVIIVRGRNIYPQDVEASAEAAHPSLRPGASAAFAIDTGEGERLCIAAELERGADPKAVIAAIRSAIAESHDAQVHTVVIVRPGSVPKTSSGKVQRQLTRRRYLDGALDVITAASLSSGDDLPSSSFDAADPLKYLRGLAAELSGAPPDSIDAATTFTSLGVDSLQAMELRNRIEADAGVTVDPSAILEGQTLGELARRFAGTEKTAPIPALALQRAPASIEQERLWYVEQVRQGHAAYHVPAAVRFTGHIDAERLRAACEKVIQKHQPLRTVFGSEDGRPTQIILPEVTRPWFYEGMKMEEALFLPFDLAEGPLFRVALGADVLAIVLHHTIADITSASLFLRELSRAYRGQALGELPVQYTDFAVWQRRQLETGAFSSHEEYWRNQLESAPLIEWGRAAEPGSGTLEFTLPPGLTSAVAAYAAARSITPFSVMLAAFMLLIQRFTGQEDVVAGTPAANRNRREIEEAIGFFAYPLPLRVRVNPDAKFDELARRAHEVTAEAMDHSALPFSSILPFYSGLQILFSATAEMADSLDIPGVRAEPAALPPVPTDFDLFVTMAGGSRGMLAYRRDLFSDAAASEFARAFITIVSDATAGRTSPLPALLESQARLLRPRHQRLSIAIASTFTAEPLEEPLAFWMKQIGYPSQFRFAPYGQIFQALLDPAGVFARNTAGLNVLLVRPEDWPLPEQNLRELSEALRGAAGKGPMWVLCLLGRQVPFDAPPGVHVMTADRIASWYPVSQVEDVYAASLGHVPFTEEYFAAVAAAIARTWYGARRTPQKVIALDCDNTLWQGVCGEDGPSAVIPNEALQRLILEKHDAGYLLCLCSKNNEDDVWAVFDAHPDMPLRREHLAAWRLNWDAKSFNIQSLAAELNLATTAFVLLDDNAVECAEVRAALPGVVCADLPPGPAEASEFVRHLWPLDASSATAEDQARTRMYRQEARRKEAERAAPSLEEFLAQLELRVDLSAPASEELERVVQLSQRTNQFNTTALRLSRPELDRFFDTGGECLVARVSDRFGDYGLVGVVLLATEGDMLRVSSFLLSCRALGRGVEERMVQRLGVIALERGLTQVKFDFMRTGRNRPAENFLEQAGERQEGAFTIPSAVAARLEPRRQSDGAHDVSAPDPAAATAPSGTNFEPDWQSIAGALRRPSAVVASMRAAAEERKISTREYVAPRTPLERTLADIWAEVLRLPRVSVDADFFELGGHSLLAVQVLSRTRDRLRADLSLDVVFGRTFTIEEMAKAIELHEIRAAGAGVDELLAELEGLSDEEVARLLNEDV